MERQPRKATRLEKFDYSSAGWYFVTVCTKGKEKILCRFHDAGSDGPDHLLLPQRGNASCEPSGPQPVYSDYGVIVHRVLSEMPLAEKFVVMPNHVHVIFHIPASEENGPLGTAAPTKGCGDCGPLGTAAPTKGCRDCGPLGTAAPTLKGLVGYMKRTVTRECGVAIWQRGYYDHIIRNEADYRRIWQYIDDNPAKWTEDEYYCE